MKRVVHHGYVEKITPQDQFRESWEVETGFLPHPDAASRMRRDYALILEFADDKRQKKDQARPSVENPESRDDADHRQA